MSRAVTHHQRTPRARRARLTSGLLVGLAIVAPAARAQVVEPAQSVAFGRLVDARLLEASRRIPTAAPAPARPFAAFSRSAQRLRDSLVALARAQVGRRYRTGGQSPEEGFDCSGLVRYLMAAVDVDLPRTAQQQSARGVPVARDPARLRPGDLLTFGSRSRVSHIGIYVGDGRFVHASSVAGRVVESPVARRPAARIKPWAGARRVIADGDEPRPAP